MVINPVKAIQNNDSANVSEFTLENHWGTHVDCPAHFFDGADTVVDYPDQFWFFSKPQLVHASLNAGQILQAEDMKYVVSLETDLLFIKSGWHEYRGTEMYSKNNPGISPEFGAWIREKYPNVRAIGFDWISLSSYEHREIGRDAHRAFLDPDRHGHPVLIIEDLDLSQCDDPLSGVIVAPLRIQGIDSAPCSVIGIFND